MSKTKTAPKRVGAQSVSSSILTQQIQPTQNVEPAHPKVKSNDALAPSSSAHSSSSHTGRESTAERAAKRASMTVDIPSRPLTSVRSTTIGARPLGHVPRGLSVDGLLIN